MSDLKKELPESDHRFRLLVNSVTDYAIFMLDPAGSVANWNPGAQKLTQYTEAEITGKHFGIFYLPELRGNKPAQELETALKHGRFEEEGWRLRKDGTRFWADVVLTPIYNEQKEHVGFAAIIRDLSVRREAEELLRQSEERAQLMISGVQDYAIFMLSPEGKIETWNLGAERLKGYRRDEIVGKHFSIFYPENERATKPPMELRVAIKEGRYEEEGWRIRKDGSRFWANVLITAVYDKNHVLRGFSKVTRDLSARREAQEKLRQSEERLHLLISGVKDYAFFMLSPAGIVETWNTGAHSLIGYRPDEIIGRHFSIFFPSDKQDNPARELQLATAEGRYEEEGWRVRKDGTQFWANVVLTALKDENGTLRGFSKVTRDLTESRKAEQQRIKLEHERIARVEAERANRIKDEFLAVVSHELRTPLTPIIGWSKLLQSQRVDAEQVKALKIIERNAQTQVKLIEDLLDISSIVSGKIKLNVHPVGLAQIIESSMDAVRPNAQAKKLKLQFVLEESVGPVLGDAVRFQQIFWNLLNNAVKFTPEGGSIVVRVCREEKFAQVAIKDSGEGIPVDYLPHVFERFSQLDSSITRKHGGLGIGLFVVRQLVELHKGKITVKSEGAGKGAEFIVELPLADKENGETAYPIAQIDMTSNTSLIGKSVLVVDDEDDARDFLAFALRRCGATVLTAASGADAMSLLKASQIDVLVSDIGMPGLDGYQLLHQIRKAGLNLPALAVTAFARGEDAVRAIDAGFQRHLPKPVNPTELCAAVAAITRKLTG
jgi:PAS domain S-box-containing protein